MVIDPAHNAEASVAPSAHLQATAVTDRWGPTHYGHLTGLLSAPLTITMALAPFAEAALAGLVCGYARAFLLLAAITVVAAGLSLASYEFGAGPVTCPPRPVSEQ